MPPALSSNTPPPSPDPALWQRAVAFAAWKHRHQIRRDGVTPYIAHPVRVAFTVREVFGCDDPVVLAAALLHDTIEDTQTDYDELLEAFGAEVADLVAALTKNMALPEAQREQEYDARLARADWRARLIKLADVFDNHSDQSFRPGPSRPPIATLPELPDRCRRAIALAAPDAAKHEPTARAIAAVRGLFGLK